MSIEDHIARMGDMILNVFMKYSQILHLDVTVYYMERLFQKI
jgi:hypothetical protein